MMLNGDGSDGCDDSNGHNDGRGDDRGMVMVVWQ